MITAAPRHPLEPDWTVWQPKERAVLCFIVSEGRVLLIHKKRGLGAGKVNAPGGKIEPGESEPAAAVRETMEEVGVTPHRPRPRGELHFQFTDGYSLHCTVFVADGCTGEPIETDEATPFWRPVDEIPYGEMWEDDRHWLPQMLRGQRIIAWFTFDHETMLTKQVESREEPVAP
ncbi:MAG TPA: 8-oxo-dGTP diphosphatase [Chthoniobacteraceae bacterium]|nr:8-oxo-dGTP diphosphatase [Chthoniobacteraceae bacterium]